jgi:hypothetical protein
MELFKNIRLKIGDAILSKKASRLERKVSYSSFGDIRSIGIVWDASRPSEFLCLSRFHQQMQSKKIEVKIFGYYPGKNLPDQYTAIMYLTCIRKDEISKFYLPMTSEANTFINNPFDVLIDINFDRQYPLRYITMLSRAKLKVGLYENGSSGSSADVMMELKRPVDLDSYLTHILHYLEMIRTTQ